VRSTAFNSTRRNASTRRLAGAEPAACRKSQSLQNLPGHLNGQCGECQLQVDVVRRDHGQVRSISGAAASLGIGARPYLVVDRSLDECIGSFWRSPSLSVTSRRFTPRSKLLRAGCPLRRQPTLLFWLQPLDVMVLRPRSSVRGTRGKGCQEESKADGKTSRRSQLRIRFRGVKRFLSLHKSFVKLAQGNPARFASPDFSVAGTGLCKLLAARRNSP
jgi:hypothetical protein